MGKGLMALMDGAEKHWQLVSALGGILLATLRWTWPNVILPGYRLTLLPVLSWLKGMARLPGQVASLATLALTTADTVNRMNDVMSNGGRTGMADQVVMLTAKVRLASRNEAGWLADSSGHNVRVDPGFTDLLGWTESDMVGDGWLRLLHPDDAHAYLDAWNQSLAHQLPFVFPHPRNGGAVRFMQASGEFLPVKVTAFPTIKEVGGVIKWVGVVERVTE
jgi:PAS domain S-box-containing protein